MKIKCGRYEYELKDGDYILDNGACYQFCPKDNSLLPWGTWHRVGAVGVSKKEFARITILPNIIKKKSKQYSFCTYYFWKENKC
jgi:hypothetical protein